MSEATGSLRLIALRQTIERALASVDDELPDGFKVAFVAWRPDDDDDGKSSTIFLSSGSEEGVRRALDSLANDPCSEEL